MAPFWTLAGLNKALAQKPEFVMCLLDLPWLNLLCIVNNEAVYLMNPFYF